MSEIGQERVFEIVVNGRPRTVSQPELTFDEVVRLAFEPPGGDNTIYTVTYRRGVGEKPEGTQVQGASVRLKNGMVFNVTPTDKS